MTRTSRSSSVRRAIGALLPAVLAVLLCLPVAFAAEVEPPGSPEPQPPAAPESEPTPEPETTPPAESAAEPLASPKDAVAPLHSKQVRLDKSSENVVRSGPGDRFAIVGVYPKGTAFPVIAKSGAWYNVRVSDTETGWIHASLCKEFDDLSHLEFRPNPKLYSRTGSFALTGYGGAYSFDRKSNTLALGGRLGYYVFEMLQAEAGVAWTHVRRPAEIVESLFGLSLEAEDFHMVFYHLTLNLELLPGRQMVPFISGGVGSTIMQGRTEPSFNVGAGTSLYISKTTAVRWEFRNYRFKSGPEDARVSNNNIEFTIGTTLLF